MSNQLLIDRRRALMLKKEYFHFEDPIVEQIVADWIGDGSGTTIQEIRRVDNLPVDTFRGNTLVGTFDEFENFTSIHSLPAGSSESATGAFGGCTNLSSIILPDSLTTIGAYSFYNCTGLQSVVIPNTVTSIGLWCFNNCTSISDLYIPVGCDLRIMKNIGDYSGDLTVNGNLTMTTNNQNDFYLRFVNVVVHGNINIGAIQSGAKDVLRGTAIYRVGGTFTITTSYNVSYSFGDTPPFVEIMGDVPNSGQRNGMFKNTGTVLHLGYEGKVSAPPNRSGVDKSTTTYVGTGISKSADEGIVDLYLANSQYATYSSKIKTWWDYNGQYRSYRVIENLTGCTNSNTVGFPYIIRNNSYETMIVPNDGCSMSSIQVLMYDAQDNGVTPDNPTDITSTAYDSTTGTISIEHVTGNITINATAE